VIVITPFSKNSFTLPPLKGLDPHFLMHVNCVRCEVMTCVQKY
jgi:hypothetical protein